MLRLYQQEGHFVKRYENRTRYRSVDFERKDMLVENY